MTHLKNPEIPESQRLNAAELGVLAHLYRGEVYRSTAWRTRLDITTNWAVAVTGLALSITFSSPQASPLPMVLVGLLVLTFLILEARRYRYFNVWRARARLLETDFFCRLLSGETLTLDGKWNTLLRDDYRTPEFHIGFLLAMGRRLRKNYCWIFMMQALCYYGKLAIHPTEPHSIQDLYDRAAIGPIPGQLVMLAGVVFHVGWMLFALTTWRMEMERRKGKKRPIAMA